MGCQPKPPLPLCKPNEYSCFNGWECISKSLYCDGTFHCSDRSDETNCPTLGGFQLLDLIIMGLKSHDLLKIQGVSLMEILFVKRNTLQDLPSSLNVAISTNEGR